MKLSRRHLIQAGGWSLLWPLLRMQRARAEGDLAPKRLLIICTPNGPILEKGPAVGGESNFSLHDWWAPLERHKSDGFFFSGMYQAGVPFGEHNQMGHQSAGVGSLTATATEGTDSATGPSIDQFVGQQLEARGVVTPKRSLLWGLHGNSHKWGPWFEAPGKPIGPQVNPFQAFADLSPHLPQSLSDGAPQLNPLARKQMVLRTNFGDCGPLRRQLGCDGRLLLDFHCDNIQSLQKSVTASLERPQVDSCQPVDHLDTTLGPEDAFGQAELNDDLTATFTKMIPLAFGCDITRVIGFSFGNASERFAIPSSYEVPSSAVVDSGDAGPQSHAWSHVSGSPPEKFDALRKFTRWYSERVANMIDVLKATPDVDGGTLFDNTMVLWTSELGAHPKGYAHPQRDIPVLLFGNSKGRFRPGRHWAADSEDQQSALVLHQMYVSLCRHAGLNDIDTFGNAGSGPLDWLEG